MKHVVPAIFLGLAVILPAAESTAAQDEIGVTAAVNPNAIGTPPQAESRVLFVGDDVVFKERIETAGAGQTQILFLDESSLTIGPGSDVILDEFVYDPATGTGDMAVSVGQGVLRFVGGRIAKNEDVIFNTPFATVGIRGSSVGLDCMADQCVAHRTSGRMFCRDEDETHVITEEGWVCLATPDGVSVEEVDPEWVRRFVARLQGQEDDGTLPQDDVEKQVNADCGASFPVAGVNRCGGGEGDLPDPKQFDDKADLDESIQEDQRDDLEFEGNDDDQDDPPIIIGIQDLP